jgi:branched-chain amino acid transport system permease protein
MLPGIMHSFRRFGMLLQTVIDGLLIGALYALVGMGLSIIFGTMRIVNFAHGEFMMIGMYVTYSLFQSFHIDPYLTIPASFLVTFLLGYLVYRGLISKIILSSDMNQILMTAGIGMVLTNLAQMTYSSDQLKLDIQYANASLKLLGLQINVPYLISFLIALLITVILFWFIMRTETGRALRAISQNRSPSHLMGINVERVSSLVFGIGIALAGVAGTLLLPVYRVSPTVGGAFTLIAFVVVVLGGMGSIVGAALGGLIIGVVESISAFYLGGSYGDLITYVVFLLILLLKPSGLLGRSKG